MVTATAARMVFASVVIMLELIVLVVLVVVCPKHRSTPARMAMALCQSVTTMRKYSTEMAWGKRPSTRVHGSRQPSKGVGRFVQDSPSSL